MEVEEARLPLGRREARFSMIEGDFKASAVLGCVAAARVVIGVYFRTL